MANNVVWVDADAAATDMDWSITRGEFTDPFGSVNDGPAVTFGNVVMEGTVDEMRNFLSRLEDMVDAVQEALAADEED